jgi:hypothetical protein
MTVGTDYAGENEIINGVNYGIPVSLNGSVFLTKDIPIEKSIKSLNASCPYGWRVPTVEELKSIIPNPYATLKTKLNMTDDTSYLTQNKSFPLALEGSNNDAWNFKGFSFNSKSTTFAIEDINTYFETATAVKCIFDTSANIPLKIATNDFIQNQVYPISIVKTNLAAFAWKVNGATQSTKDISVTFSTIGCNSLELWAKNSAGQTVYNCRNIWVSPLIGTEASVSTIAVKETDLQISAARMIYLFWNRGNAPIAPKLTGGFYIVYTENSSNDTYVAEYSSSLTLVTNNKLGVKGYPCDIVASEAGFMVYLKDVNDNNKAWITTYDNSFNKLATRTIMNNGITPSRITEQQSFYDSKGVVLSGNEAMFAASSGKLAYGRGKYALLFSHYNAFGSASARDDHQGDTFYDFDTKASIVNYAWTWKTSHSLHQTQIYTGRYFVTASLGDIFPENIKVCIIDMQDYTTNYDAVNKGNFEHPSVCTDIVKGKICGNGGGKTCGRIGGLIQMTGDIVSLVYVRKPCSFSGYKGVQTSSTDNEIGMITFSVGNMAFTNMKYYSFGKGDSVIAIRAGRYGSNIFITYSTVATNTGNEPQQEYVLGDKSLETQYNMLVDINGNVITQPIVNAGNLSVSPSDEIRYLSDGTPIWSYVDTNNKLFLYTLTTPPKQNNVNTAGIVDIGVNGGGINTNIGGTTGLTNSTTTKNTSDGGLKGVSIVFAIFSCFFFDYLITFKEIGLL